MLSSPEVQQEKRMGPMWVWERPVAVVLNPMAIAHPLHDDAVALAPITTALLEEPFATEFAPIAIEYGDWQAPPA
jgi:hypothetical protein